MVVGKTCVAGFRYLIPVMPGNWAWMLSSSTEPSGSTCTLTKADYEMLHLENQELWIPRKALLPLPHRLIWSPGSFLSSNSCLIFLKYLNLSITFPIGQLCMGSKRSVWFRVGKEGIAFVAQHIPVNIQIYPKLNGYSQLIHTKPTLLSKMCIDRTIHHILNTQVISCFKYFLQSDRISRENQLLRRGRVFGLDLAGRREAVRAKVKQIMFEIQKYNMFCFHCLEYPKNLFGKSVFVWRWSDHNRGSS